MSSMRLGCPHCRQPVDAPVELAGSVVACPHCRQQFFLQAPQQQAAAPQPEQHAPPVQILVCPHCQKQLQIPPEMAGRTVACPICAGPFVVPGNATQSTAQVSLPQPPPKPREPTPYDTEDPGPADSMRMILTDDDMKFKDDEKPKPPPPSFWKQYGKIIIPVAALIIILATVAAVLYARQGGTLRKPKEPTHHELFTLALREQAGWVGTSKLDDGSSLIIASIDDYNQLAVKFNDQRNAAVHLMGFYVKPFNTSFTIDSSAVKLIMPDDKIISALPQADVINTMYGTNDLVRHASGPLTFAPGKHTDCGFIFFLHSITGFDLKKMTGVTISVNGNPVTVQGRYMTSEEKKSQLSVSSGQKK